MKPDTLWLGLGFFAQALFAARFVVQWLKSERAGMSVMPVSFWYLSIFGSVLLLVYAIHKKDAVFILGQLTGSLIYTRNLYLIHQRRPEPAAT
ncbi:MAG TPA: lipid-A-disaccharide synthase N-terminal domain-containing protein [Candidatus Krumholzibacteria bacterium]|nr:lipid-A-disaccharide synthase N-terminal domain-containing protein [Candidatus Krumholzibacteria bacterium]